MNGYIDDYCVYLKEYKNSSENTLKSIRRDLHKLHEFMTDNAVADIRQVTESHMNSYMMYLENGEFATATIARHMSSARGYFRYLLEQHVIDKSPVKRFKSPKVVYKELKVLTVEEVDRLLAVPNGKSNKDIRDKAMLELLYATGIRVSELVELKVEDVNLSLSFLVCRDSGRERLVPFGRNAQNALTVYLKNARPELVKGNDDILFSNVSGGKMSRQGFWKLIKKYGEMAGIDKTITPHILRHSFAMHLMENGADIRSVQEMLGHSDVSVTSMIYARKSGKKLREEYKRAHPRS